MSPVVRSTVAPAARAAGTPSVLAASREVREQTAAAKGRARTDHRVAGARKIVDKELPNFSRQLAAMLSAGLPIVASLETLAQQTDNPNFKSVINSVKANIENGTSFSEALKPYGSIFSELYVNMVRGGETGGMLAETIGRIAGFLEASAKLRRKVKSALTYPVIVLCLAMTIATGLIIFVVPVFGNMFKEFGSNLPGPTQFLMDLGTNMKMIAPVLIVVIVIGMVLFRRWKKTTSGAYTVDSFVLKLPVFGVLIQKVAAARFARTFAQLIRSGVPILSALDIVAGATGNKVAGKIVLDARLAVEKGEPLSSAMVNQTVFPPMLVRMLMAGEKTGKVDEMMEKIAEFYEDEVDTMLSGLTAMLEPLLMVFLGVIVGGIMVCMFLPIFKLPSIIQM